VSSRALPVNDTTEWLEADGLGGFASGTTSGVRTRRYHALLLGAASPPADRRVLVSGFVARLDTPEGSVELWPQAYGGGWVTGRDVERLEFFRDPWPHWRMQTRLGVAVEVEIFAVHGHSAVVVGFRLDRPIPGARLELCPLLAGRDFHQTHHENPSFDFRAEPTGSALRFAPYPGVPPVSMLANAQYRPAPDWYRNFYYAEEAARGLDAVEDLASPGVFEFAIGAEEAVWLLSADVDTSQRLELGSESPLALAERLRQAERERRSAFASPLERDADAYRVRRGQGHTLIAGYPWFGDWGRDTFIALRGLCLATSDLETARSILVQWSSVVSQGMLPNRFPDSADSVPEYNSVDASLWYILAADELLSCPGVDAVVSAEARRSIDAAILEIVAGYARGTRHGIRRDADGLLACGEPGQQLTWMDAKVGDWVVTPRIGKPVEIQALWVHALLAAAKRDSTFRPWVGPARAALEARFWNETRQMLFDVVDENHVPGVSDAACRPNQIFAAGGLPITLLSESRARQVVAAVERQLLTPLGLRSLEPAHLAYARRYEGGVFERDGAYHQGTVWPWLLGPFVEAWVKVRGNTEEAKIAARQRFVAPLLAHLSEAGLGHISEIADAEPPHAPRGCPFQAWSLSELIRLERVVLGPSPRINPRYSSESHLRAARSEENCPACSEWPVVGLEQAAPGGSRIHE
jgi:predicted glycogen debranching enzyme